ncbi:MAG: hypothetical protein AAF416_09550 [Pseudomonadota bacterium]
MREDGNEGESSSFAIAAGLAAVNAEVIAWGVLLFLMVDGVLSVLFGTAPRVLMHFFFDALVVHAGLRSMLSGGRFAGLDAVLTADGRMPWLFVFRAVVLMMPGILALLMIGGLMMPVLGTAGALIAGVVVGLATYAITFALFGTMLADLAAGGDGNPEVALGRGQARFAAAFALMLTGPVLAELALYVVDRLVYAIALPDRAILPETEHISLLGLGVDAILLTGGIYVSLVTAAVLGRTWLGRI